MSKIITDKWPLRHMRLDDEVYEALMELKKKYGSPNKGLRAVLLDIRHDGFSGIESLDDDAEMNDKIFAEWQAKAKRSAFKGPLLKPSEKK